MDTFVREKCIHSEYFSKCYVYGNFRWCQVLQRLERCPRSPLSTVRLSPKSDLVLAGGCTIFEGERENEVFFSFERERTNERNEEFSKEKERVNIVFRFPPRTHFVNNGQEGFPFRH